LVGTATGANAANISTAIKLKNKYFVYFMFSPYICDYKTGFKSKSMREGKALYMHSMERIKQNKKKSIASKSITIISSEFWN
jgi:hypothetical protein